MPVYVDADDWIGARDAGSHNRCQSNRPSAQNGNAGIRPNGQRVENGAGSGLQAATEGSKQFEIEILRNLDEVSLGSQRVRGKRRLPKEVTPNSASRQGIAAIQ